MNLDVILGGGFVWRRKPASHALKEAGLDAWLLGRGLFSPLVPPSSSHGSSLSSLVSIGSRSPFPCGLTDAPPGRDDGQKLTPRLSSMGSVGSEEDGEAAAVMV